MPTLASHRFPPLGFADDAAAHVSAPDGGNTRREHILPPAVPRIQSHEIHLWTFTPETAAVAEYTSLLSTEELERAERFRFPELFERFVSDHGRLRLLLASYLQAEPQSITFEVNEQGKPRVSGPNCRLRFNMSHTRGLTAIAICLDAEIGVDVEAMRIVEDRDEIATYHFSAPEIRALQAHPAAARDTAFLRCWTRKEAYIKARGEGLSLPLDGFSVSIENDDSAALTDCAWSSEEPSRWKMHPLQLPFGHIGALAIEQGEWSVSQFHWHTGILPRISQGVFL